MAGSGVGAVACACHLPRDARPGETEPTDPQAGDIDLRSHMWQHALMVSDVKHDI